MNLTCVTNSTIKFCYEISSKVTISKISELFFVPIIQCDLAKLESIEGNCKLVQCPNGVLIAFSIASTAICLAISVIWSIPN